MVIMGRVVQYVAYCTYTVQSLLCPRSGKLPSSEHSVLDAWYRFLTRDLGKSKGKFDLSVDLIVYLRTTPEMALQRVKQRFIAFALTFLFLHARRRSEL